MADDVTPPDDAGTASDKDVGTGDKQPEQTVPYERFQQANTKAKEAAARATALEKDMKDLRATMEERENAGLPELERERKRAEALEKRIADAEAKAAEAEAKVARSAKAGLVRGAAKDFTDPDDAVAFVNLDDVEDERDAERAVKALAKRKPHLLRVEEPMLPGKVLVNGQTPAGSKEDPRMEEAEMLVGGLKQFLQNQQ